MVREQLVSNGISDPRVLDVMLKVPRHLFLDDDLGPQAYSGIIPEPNIRIVNSTIMLIVFIPLKKGTSTNEIPYVFLCS